ncbi:hypothetical protein AMJ83_05045 [candidate division WOR_3 bacterium SM23_42]|uniref:ARG and Rhodanese-Phosphatase-superfamily-associated domain-containing protein n=1 Tax=candidate division WOR_3 bacterium SM23_42 TaxID=1703779 RepID=A0A0S8FTE1_UNCW3|nr:MAG: hypothetical protein AMJ83_05045 [candidate division WOR_3 bacterium SM23_42]
MKLIAFILMMFLASSQVADKPAAIRSSLKSLVISKSITYKNLTIFPLTRSFTPETEYVTLDEAMKRNWLTIREIGSGEVNFVELRNTGSDVVFIMTGEMISGAKQDRMLRDDVLIPPKSDWLKVPVYCVEHGRWVSVSSAFKSSELVVPNELRQRARITENQSQVWDEIASSQDRLGITSGTGAARANYEDEDTKKELTEYTKRLADIPKIKANTVGVCVTTGNRIICVDIFANNDLLMKYWHKLLKSYVMDAMHETKSTVHKTETQGLLDALSYAHTVSIGTPGLGNLFKIETDFGKGSALVHRDNVVHMDFFIEDLHDEPEWRLDMRRDQRLND